MRKQFQSMTSPVIQPNGSVGDPIAYQDTLSSSLRTVGGDVQLGGQPVDASLRRRPLRPRPARPPQPVQDLTNPAGTPGTFESEFATFTVEGLPKHDNGKAEVRVQWPDAGVDWDVYVYDAQGRQVASAASLADPEVAVLIDPVPGTYTVELVNYEGGETSDWTGEVVFGSPTPASYTGVKEAWTLPCSTTDGRVSRRSRSWSTAARPSTSATPASATRADSGPAESEGWPILPTAGGFPGRMGLPSRPPGAGRPRGLGRARGGVGDWAG